MIDGEDGCRYNGIKEKTVMVQISLDCYKERKRHWRNVKGRGRERQGFNKRVMERSRYIAL